MTELEKVIRALENCTDEIKCRDCPWETCETFCLSVKVPLDLAKAALSLLKAQEPRVLQIKEMAFLENAVFIETNGDLEGKGTDLFLAIPYIYAVSQNVLDGYIAFVDGNTDVYDLQAIDYGKRWRCWTSRPTDEQREAVKWDG